MPLIRDGRFVSDDWVRHRGDAEIPAGAAKLLVPWAFFEEHGARVASDGHELGADVTNDIDPEALQAAFPKLKLIAVAFPKAADGRGFSIATRLRRLGYSHELRASGYLIADQYALARNCGFDTVEISDDLAERQPEPHWLEAQRAMTLAYQRGYGELQNILTARWSQST